MSREPQIGRVRGLYMDMLDGLDGPRRGDRVTSGKTWYYVLSSYRVKRRDPSAVPRYQMRVIRLEDMPEGLGRKLIRSAIRRGCGSVLFTFKWYPRKRMTFEQYMRRKVAL